MSKLLKVRKISPYKYGLPLGCRSDDRFIVVYNQQFSEKVKTTNFFFLIHLELEITCLKRTRYCRQVKTLSQKYHSNQLKKDDFLSKLNRKRFIKMSIIETLGRVERWIGSGFKEINTEGDERSANNLFPFYL